MPKKFIIESPIRRCPFCEKLLPVVSISEKKLATFFEYEVMDMSQIQRVCDNLFHIDCVNTPEFAGWLPCFLKKKGQFKRHREIYE